MGKRIFAVFWAVMLVASFTVPVFAQNTVGVVRQDLDFLGVQISPNPGYTYTYSASEDAVYKYYRNSDPVSVTSADGFNFIFRAPADCYSIRLNCSLSLAVTGFNTSTVEIYVKGFEYDRGTVYTGDDAQRVYPIFPASKRTDSFNCSLRDVSLESTSSKRTFSYIVVSVYFKQTVLFTDSISFSSSGTAALTGKYNGTGSYAGTGTSKDSGSVSQDGTISAGFEGNGHYASSGSTINMDISTKSVTPNSDLSNSPFILYEHPWAENGEPIYLYPYCAGVVFAQLQFRMPASDSPFAVDGDISGSLQSSGSATLSGTSRSSGSSTHAGTSSDTGTTEAELFASSLTQFAATAHMSSWYGDDDGLVDTVKHMDKTLDNVADNMQQVVDHMNQEKETGDDIGTAAGDESIGNTGETLAGGVGALDQSLDTAGDVAAVSSGAGMYINLLSATVSPMLNFGNGVLYWAVFAVLILSVLLFIMRRLF